MSDQEVSFGGLVERNRWSVRRWGKLALYCTSCAVVLHRIDGEWRQLLQFGFLNRDHSLYATWPYLNCLGGAVGNVTFDPDTPPPKRAHVREAGKLTQHIVKYSHHRSGLAQFSLTERVKSVVRRQSFPLDTTIGRLFEFQSLRPAAFSGFKTPKAKRVYIPTGLADIPGSGVLIRAEWVRKEDIRRNAEKSSRTVGPFAGTINRRTGEEAQVVLVGAPIDHRDDGYCVSLSMHLVSPGAEDGRTNVIFTGGWDPHEVGRGQGGKVSRQTGALFALYPFLADDELQRHMGSIDLPAERLATA